MCPILYYGFSKGLSKIHEVPEPGLRTGEFKVLLAVIKERQKHFLTNETWGFVLRGHYSYLFIKKGEATFFTSQILKGITFC